MSFEEKQEELNNKLRELNEKLNLLDSYRKYHQLEFLYPDSGPMSREGYEKHLEFFKASTDHRYRLISGGNGTGKTYALAYEIAIHATGLYPHWWEGKQLKKPRSIWIIAESGKTFKESLQKYLVGHAGDEVGTGFIPKHTIEDYSALEGVPGAVGTLIIRHAKGHLVTLSVKTYDTPVKNLQGANIEFAAFDEEPPKPIYDEIIMRTRGSKTKEPGIVAIASTPTKGITDTVLNFLPNGKYPINREHPLHKERWAIAIDMDEVPHYTKADVEQLLAEIPENQRAMRKSGIPGMGAGRVYPIHEQAIVVEYLQLPPHWRRAYGIDFGWNTTAVVWMCENPDTGERYIYDEYIAHQQLPAVIAAAIKARGKWMPGVGDPAGGQTQSDGTKLLKTYIDLELNLQVDRKGKSLADNSVAAGIAIILDRMNQGLFKVLSTCQYWIEEFRLYRYDEKHPDMIARNQKDHAMDATRYIDSVFDQIAKSYDEHLQEQEAEEAHRYYRRPGAGRNNITGY